MMIQKMKTIIFPIFLICLALKVSAQTPDYAVSAIPDSLRSHANAVVRNEIMNIDIARPDAVWITYKKAITILNPNGMSFGAIAIYYNKSRPVQDISGALYDANGNLVRELRKSDFEDMNVAQDYALFEDFRVKRMSPAGRDYPYTLEYQYTQKYKFTLYLPDWTPVDDYGESIQQASLSVTAPSIVPVRFKGANVNPPAIDSISQKGKIIYHWNLNNMTALNEEPYSPPLFQSDFPWVILSPENFSYYGMKGTFNNWKEYGQWVSNHLLNDKNKLPDATVSYIRQMTQGLSSPIDVAKKIYEYAQQKNRYVAIEIGRGGFIPMSASEVDKAGYGDCKALVNYTMALLKAVNISSYYTEVNAGDDDISLLSDFASAGQGNHVILCVPFQKDTVWLECTNKSIPFGYLGSFTDNRSVVICSSGGGVLTHTPKYADDINLQKRSAQFFIDSTGDLEGKMTTAFKGLLYEKRADLENQSKLNQINHVKNTYSFLQMNITDYGLTFVKKQIPSVIENISFTSPLYAAPSGNGLNIPINPVNRLQNVPAMVSNRKDKVYISNGFIQTDSLCFNLPEGYTVSFIPPASDIHTMFGDYKTCIKAKGQKLLYVREFSLKSGCYAAESYGLFVDFLQQVASNDQDSFMISHL